MDAMMDVVLEHTFQKPDSYEEYGGARQWRLEAKGSGAVWRHAPTKYSVDAIPMIKVAMVQAMEAQTEMEARMQEMPDSFQMQLKLGQLSKTFYFILRFLSFHGPFGDGG
jgi:hypothetical protein